LGTKGYFRIQNVKTEGHFTMAYAYSPTKDSLRAALKASRSLVRPREPVTGSYKIVVDGWAKMLSRVLRHGLGIT